jgi:hypothetical protein
MYLLSLSAGGWLLFLQSLFVRFVRDTWFSSPVAAMINALSIYTAMAFLFYRIFIVEERDQKIFDKYINAWHGNPYKKRDLIITSFVAAAPYVSMVCIKLYLHR